MAEKNIELDSVEVAAAVFGNCDRNIRLLENEFSVTAVCRARSCGFQANRPMLPRPAALWRECCF